MEHPIKNTPNIHETAFVTAMYRASDEKLSKDIYAKLWNSKKTEVWVDHFIHEVSIYEKFTHCLRNRYFYDKLASFITKNKIELLINFGCGFSMYPFLLNQKLISIEIDKPEVIAYKKDKIKKFQSDNKLPLRNIHYISTDFASDFESGLFEKIKAIKGNKQSFILIEGVLFFLNKKETDKLFELFRRIQSPDEFIGSVSFDDSVQKLDVFNRLLSFLNPNNTKQFPNYQTIPIDYYQSLTDYKIIDKQDYYSLSKTFSPQNAFNKDADMLNESMYVLKKVK